MSVSRSGRDEREVGRGGARLDAEVVMRWSINGWPSVEVNHQAGLLLRVPDGVGSGRAWRHSRALVVTCDPRAQATVVWAVQPSQRSRSDDREDRRRERVLGEEGLLYGVADGRTDLFDCR